MNKFAKEDLFGKDRDGAREPGAMESVVLLTGASILG